MKKVAFFLVLLIFFSCQKQEFEKSEFESWASKNNFNDLEVLYENLNSDLDDLRESETFIIDDLVIVDEITEYVQDSSDQSNVYMTLSSGMTSVYYKDEHIFTGSWGRNYMSPYNFKTLVSFGTIFAHPVIRISNQTPGVGLEHKLFISYTNHLEEIDLKSIGVTNSLGTIKATENPETILMKSSDFIRSKNPKQRYILYDLKTKETFVCVKSY